MSTAAAAATAANKTLRVNSALEGNASDYTPFAQDFLRKHPSATLAAAIHALNCHTADMFLLFLSILSEKYGHSVDELVATIREDERWTEAQVHPLVKSLNYFEQADVGGANTNTTAIPGKTQADVATEQLHDEVAAPKKSRAAPKTKAAAAAPAEEAPAAAAAAEAAPAPAKKASAKKKTTVSDIAEAAGVGTSVIAEAAAQAAEAKPKKATKAKAAAAAAAPEEAEAAPAEAEVKPKKATKAKAAAAPADAEVDAAAEAIASLTVSDAAAATAAKPKKTVARKPAAAKAV